MKRRKSLLGFLSFLLVTAVIIPAVPVSQESADKKIENLQTQLASLELRVAGLEKHIERLTLAIPQKFPDIQQLPKGWQRHEFNGMTYFIIPVDKDSNNSGGAIR